MTTDRKSVEPRSGALAQLGAELLSRAEASQPLLEAAWDALMARWGIRGKPIPIESLRASIQQESDMEPGGASFSQELIALRECRRP